MKRIAAVRHAGAAEVRQVTTGSVEDGSIQPLALVLRPHRPSPPVAPELDAAIDRLYHLAMPKLRALMQCDMSDREGHEQ